VALRFFAFFSAAVLVDFRAMLSLYYVPA
jgi:hypothetical protein